MGASRVDASSSVFRVARPPGLSLPLSVLVGKLWHKLVNPYPAPITATLILAMSQFCAPGIGRADDITLKYEYEAQVRYDTLFNYY